MQCKKTVILLALLELPISGNSDQGEVMFIRTLEDVRGTDRCRVLLNGALHSARYLAAADGMGFSLHVNRSEPCPPMTLWYKNHWEANYVIRGEGLLEDLSSGQSWPMRAGVVYVVGPKHRHRFRADSELQAISIFNPPLLPDMDYDEDGSLDASGEIPPGPGALLVKQLDELRAEGHEQLVAGDNTRRIDVLLLKTLCSR